MTVPRDEQPERELRDDEPEDPRIARAEFRELWDDDEPPSFDADYHYPAHAKFWP